MTFFPTVKEDDDDAPEAETLKLAGVERALELQLETELKYDVSSIVLEMAHDA